MKVNVYTKNNKVQSIDLNVDINEFFTIQKALCIYAGNPDIPVEDRLVAVVITDDMNGTEKFDKTELDDLN